MAASTTSTPRHARSIPKIRMVSSWKSWKTVRHSKQVTGKTSTRERIPMRTMPFLSQVLTLTLLLTPIASTAQNALPPLEQVAPAGNVLRPGHLGRQTGDLEQITHFYYDLLGTGIRGERNEPRRFFTTPGLLEFAATPDYADFRAVILPLPGTAADAG